MHTLEIKRPWYSDLLIAFFTLLLMGVVVWAFFIKEDPIPIAGPAIIILLIIMGIGSVILFFAWRMHSSHTPILSVDLSGFEYNPGGVSTGFVFWWNVAEIKEVEVRTTRGDLPGMVWELTLAVKLKDPTEYTQQFNAFIRGLMQLNDKMYDADIFFRLSDFGKQREEVKALMIRNWEASRRPNADLVA